jgi:hypothetical protein
VVRNAERDHALQVTMHICAQNCHKIHVIQEASRDKLRLGVAHDLYPLIQLTHRFTHKQQYSNVQLDICAPSADHLQERFFTMSRNIYRPVFYSIIQR